MSKSAPFDAGDYGSEFDSESDSESKRKKKRREEDVPRKKHAKHEVASKDVLKDEYEKDERIRHRIHFLALNGYDRHKQLVNNYLMYYGGRNADFARDASKDKRDIDVIRENHQFLWDDDDDDDDDEDGEGSRSWERNLAKKYWDKLYKEYCICDLSRYKENKVAMRWRIEKEVVDGNGQFTCGNKKCEEREGMKTWEVNFAYLEHGEKKNALVKVRLCPDCSYKLNYHSKKREIKKEKRENKRARKEKKRRKGGSDEDEEKDNGGSTSSASSASSAAETTGSEAAQDPATHWKGPAPKIDEDKSKDEEFEDYLEDLFM